MGVPPGGRGGFHIGMTLKFSSVNHYLSNCMSSDLEADLILAGSDKCSHLGKGLSVLLNRCGYSRQTLQRNCMDELLCTERRNETMVFTSTKELLEEFFKFVVRNPSQSSSVLTILVPIWFIITSLVFFHLR